MLAQKPRPPWRPSHHGDLRRKQGYTAAMVVEEPRLLQVCLFTTLHQNTDLIEYSTSRDHGEGS